MRDAVESEVQPTVKPLFLKLDEVYLRHRALLPPV